jgi:hypothetical protein
MLDFFEIRAEHRLHPVIYQASLGGFALVRLWECATIQGPNRGRAFENALYGFCERQRLWLSERAGSQTLCNATSASGLRHESDGVIACADVILHVETKHLTGRVSKNDLMVFNQKGLDFVLSGDPRLRSRPLYRMFLSGSSLSREARRFSLLWGIITIEPDLMPLPLLHWLAGSTFVATDRQRRVADRIWHDVPVLAAPLQERICRLPGCLHGAEEIIAPSRIEWALDKLQDDHGAHWWRDLDCRDPFWLDRVYTNCTLWRSEATEGHADA